MKPLIVLLISFIISLVYSKINYGSPDLPLSGRISFSVMLLFTAAAHFKFTKGMEMMLPGFIAYKTQIVTVTGFIEIFAASGLFIPNLRIITAWLLIVFFILILPSNIYGAMKHVNYQSAAHNGSGLNYLWFRIPLQVFFIIWIYFSSIKA
jgi:uncharacterized membrane protein